MSRRGGRGEVGVLDYGMGNLRSVEKALERAGARGFVSHDRRRLEKADRLVVPGVGGFEAAARVLRNQKLDGFLKDWVGAGRPTLGICLGLQLLFESSEEAPGVRGLGLLAGRVVRFRPRARAVKVPHMGWNLARPEGPAAAEAPDLLPRPDRFYFVHSYYPCPADPRVVWTRTSHGELFCSGILQGNLAATQFHPEKSGPAGLAFLRRWLGRADRETACS